MITIAGVAIQSKIYESSNSLVYRGTRVGDGRAIIVKMLKQNYPSPQELTRYKQEYEITRSLNLEGVVKAYSQQDYQRTLVILLEDFGGESLEQWMHKCPDFCPMPLSAFLQLAINLTDILGRIHAANVIHKDINPGNIVLNQDTGVVKIIDFGIATRFNRTNQTFKSPHVLEGTLAYLSPEQTGRMNRWLDYRTDFYSLGVTFYRLLTEHLPFPTTDILELVHCHVAKQPVPPHELKATIPKVISDIILKLIAKNAEERYQSAWGIKADLESCDRQLKEIGQINSIQLGLQDISNRFQIPQKLYGRDKEIATLLAAFDRVASPEDNCIATLQNNAQIRFKVEMMLVTGYAGIGKSALVQELYKPITQKRGYFISGKFDQLQRNIPYSAIVAALRKLVQQLLGESNEQVQQWRSKLLNALGSNGQIIIDVIPEVELIIGKQPLVSDVGATESQNRFNLTFQSFVRVFCSKQHPLVIFLDDLQWVDSATLKLIELMLLDEQTQYLFLIGAYRDNEANLTHPLVLTLLRLRQQGAVLQEIVLAPLTLLPLSQLIAQTLHQDAETVCALSQLVLRKTEGNPFFVGEFLRMLYSESLLSFDGSHLSWQWNIAQIEAQNITDNVVELMLLKLKKLPEETQQILRLAACVGSEFDLDTLAIVCEKSPKTVFQDLLPAVQGGFIQPLSELDEDLLAQEYKFLHDRVQQAAYALIPEDQKQVTHYSIGQLLLSKLSEVEQSEMLFDIVNHINFGQSLLTQEDEKEKIARLNLAAAQKAISSLMTDISAHKQAEEVLRHSEAQFREQAILSAFRADVDSALAQSDSLPLILHRCAEAVVKHFNAAFARIWTLNKDENVLELQASAGMYTRLDGTYSRIPVGSFKIGRIARERCPLLTNNVFDEPSIDQEWAEREGMVAFAGYPILLDEQLVGVIAMFTRQPIPLSNFEALEFAAREIALGIRRKQAEEALQASEAELRALFSAMPDPLWVVDAEGRILRAILIESEKLSKPIDEQVGQTLYEIFERSQADTFLGCIRQALSTQQPLTIEYSLIIGGWKTWFATRISPISEHSVIWLARDITDRKRAEEASILEERNHMAREIHDTLAQAFTGIIIHARSASNEVMADPEKAQTLLTQILDLARSGLAEARRSVEALHRPYLLESSNLQDALSCLAAQLDSSITTQIVYEVIGTTYPLSSDLENNLFRIGQEALTNAIKYAKAHEIRIELVYEPTQCILRIKDDGQGFDVENQAMRNGFGLLGMAQRAERIRAELKIQSHLGQGTEIVVSIDRNTVRE